MSDPIAAMRGAVSGGNAAGGIDGPRRYTLDLGRGEAGDRGSAGSFGDTLTKAINQVTEAQDRSTDLVQQFLRGDPVELHQVMAASEESGIALEMMIELRNKFTDAYRALINMQS